VKGGVLSRWFSVLPESCYEGKPSVQFLYLKALTESGEVELADTRLRTIEDKLSGPEWKPFVGTFLYLSAYVSLYRRDILRTTEYLEKFDRHMPEGSYMQMIQANTCTTNYDTLLVFFDDLQVADEFFKKWINVWENRDHYPFVGFFYVAYSLLLYEWNRLEEAEDYVERALRQKSLQPYALILVNASIYAARISQARRDSAKAFELLEQVKPKIDSPDKSIFIQRLDAEKAHLSLANGSFDYVAAWLQSCGLNHNDAIPQNRIREYLHLASALIEFGYLDEAIGLLERLYRIVNDEDRLRDKVKVSIVQSIAFHRKGEAKNALMKLEAALQLAEPGGFIRSFIEEGARMDELLTQYLHIRQHNLIGNSTHVSLSYVNMLLQVMKVHMIGSPISGALTRQELKIVQMIGMGLSNKQIAEQTQVKAETVKSHLKNIYRKLGVNSRIQALQRGKEMDLL
jgi:LuxR family maltose regulon positive regulatory protein